MFLNYCLISKYLLDMCLFQLAAAYEQHFGSSVVRHADDDTAELSADDILSLLRDYDSDDDMRTASQVWGGKMDICGVLCGEQCGCL